MARIQPTADQLHSAWQRMRRPHWPDTWEQTMRDPVRAAIVRSAAVRQVLRETMAPPNGNQPSARRTRTSPPLPRSAPSFDRKRAAAGEHEDD